VEVNFQPWIYADRLPNPYLYWCQACSQHCDAKIAAKIGIAPYNSIRCDSCNSLFLESVEAYEKCQTTLTYADKDRIYKERLKDQKAYEQRMERKRAKEHALDFPTRRKRR
jgi:hypothetical protein